MRGAAGGTPDARLLLRPRVARWRRLLAGLIVVATVVALVVWPLWFLVTLLVGPVLAGLCVLSPDPVRPPRRHRVMEVWAERHGWSYAMLDRGLAATWSGPPFVRPAETVCREVLVRRADGVLSFTIRRDDLGATRTEPGHAQAHVVVVALPAVLPRLVLRPHAYDVALGRTGQDLVTESPDFNRAWRVQSDDSRLAHGGLHPVLMDRLMAADIRAAEICTDGASLRAWWPGRTDLDLLEQRAAAVLDLARSVPRHVWQDHGYDPGPGVRA